jgi:Domain of unknown function (DUF4340)
MQQKRNVRLLISLVVLTASVLLISLLGYRPNNEVDRELFKVADQAQIDKVIFESDSSKIELKFNGTRWWVNDKEADRQLIKVFFATILQAEPKRKVSGAALDSVKKHVAEKTKLTLWVSDQVAKEFFVAGNSTKSETYFSFDGNDWYVVTIPGYRVYVASIFDLGENDWRDKRIFNFNWQNFKSLKAHFPQQPNQDFTISFANKLFGIEEIAVADTTRLSNYLESIFNLQAERILAPEEAKKYDSLFAAEPFLQIEIQDISMKAFRLKIYSSLGKSKLVVAKMNEEPILVQTQLAASVMRRREYFVLQEKKVNP